MDNAVQVEEIRKYREQLCEMLGKNVDYEAAALIWIRKYAQIWRLQHPRLATLTVPDSI
jgi:hypothetical protein